MPPHPYHTPTRTRPPDTHTPHPTPHNPHRTHTYPKRFEIPVFEVRDPPYPRFMKFATYYDTYGKKDKIINLLF